VPGNIFENPRLGAGSRLMAIFARLTANYLDQRRWRVPVADLPHSVSCSHARQLTGTCKRLATADCIIANFLALAVALQTTELKTQNSQPQTQNTTCANQFRFRSSGQLSSFSPGEKRKFTCQLEGSRRRLVPENPVQLCCITGFHLTTGIN